MRRRDLAWATALVVALSVLAFGGGGPTASAQKSPSANKVAVAGEGALVQAENQEETLLTTTMKNPGSKALLISVTLECSILTELTTVGNDTASAQATAVVWVEVNGTKVAYEDDPAPDPEDTGKVTFCDRAYQRTTSLFDDANATIHDFIETKSSHGFNWAALDTGSGDKTIVVKAELTEVVNDADKAVATLVIGARTLTVEPVDVAVDETLSN